MKRLIRFILVGIVVYAAFVGIQILAQKSKGATVPQLQDIPLVTTLEQAGAQVLGTTTNNLPKLNTDVKIPLQGEPVAQPVESINNQTNQLLESIKQLPEDQLKALKKQLYKEFCDKLLKE